MLKRIVKPPQIREFCTYDLEWVPKTYRLRIVGVYDSERGYRSYSTITEFLDNELTSKNFGVWFYAHAGGLADIQFIIEEVLKKGSGYKIRGSLSGSAIIAANISQGKHSWMFVDSYWLLREKLKNIAEWIGEKKTGPTDDMTDEERQDWYANISIEILRQYNQNDCEILWRAIQQMQLLLLEHGGQLQRTQASSAMNLFRRKYLSQDIRTSVIINNFASLSYFASRVEVIQTTVPYSATYYDVNSSFPHAMTFPLPGKFHRAIKGLPDWAWRRPFISKCVVNVPESTLPPIPKRTEDGRIFFPWGIWEGTYTSIDLQLLLKQGGHIESVSKTYLFDEFYDLGEYAKDLYDKKKKAKTDFERAFYKLLLNSLYGKFAEKQQKRILYINPPRHILKHIERDREMLCPGAFVKTIEVPVPHQHLPIASFITAIARRTLFQFAEPCSEIHYMDTDGFSTTDKLQTGNELGELKIEKVFSSAIFLLPKLYVWQSEKEIFIKAKGFPKLKVEEFTDLAEGKAISFYRMARMRENLRKDETHPRDVKIKKRLNQNNQPKRFVFPNGQTRPWHVSEIQ